jgi:hypothetical protein
LRNQYPRRFSLFFVPFLLNQVWPCRIVVCVSRPNTGRCEPHSYCSAPPLFLEARDIRAWPERFLQRCGPVVGFRRRRGRQGAPIFLFLKRDRGADRADALPPAVQYALRGSCCPPLRNAAFVTAASRCPQRLLGQHSAREAGSISFPSLRALSGGEGETRDLRGLRVPRP